MILVFRIMMLVVIVLLLLFCMSNLDAVTVRLLGWESPEMPLFLLLLFVFFFGFFLALVWQAWNGIGPARPVIDRSPVKLQKPAKEKADRKWGLRRQTNKKSPGDKKQEEDAEEKQSESDKPESEEGPGGSTGNEQTDSTAKPADDENKDTQK